MQKEMLPYLQKIISLEQAAYVEGKVLNVVKNERENTDTRKYVVPEPKPPEPETIDTEFFTLITVFIGGPIAIGVGVLRLIGTLDLGAGFGAAFITFAIFAFLVFLWVAVDAKQDNDDRKEKYQQALAQYPIDVQNEEDAYQQALRLAGYYDQLIAQQEKKLADTRRLLQGAYDKGLLYGKYRNFVAVCSICEYLESGRCSELGGPERRQTVPCLLQQLQGQQKDDAQQERRPPEGDQVHRRQGGAETGGAVDDGVGGAQHQVQKQQVIGLRQGGVQPRRAVGAYDGFIAAELQIVPLDGGDVGVILDDENFRHMRPPLQWAA